MSGASMINKTAPSTIQSGGGSMSDGGGNSGGGLGASTTLQACGANPQKCFGDIDMSYVHAVILQVSEWHAAGVLFKLSHGPLLKRSMEDLYPLYITLYLIVIVAAVIGNVAMIYTIMKQRLFRDQTYIIIINLGFLDLLKVLFIMPLTLANLLIYWVFGNFICYAFPIIQWFSVYTSWLTFTCITVDRYRFIAYPSRSRLPVIFYILGAWAVGVGSSLPYSAFVKFIDVGSIPVLKSSLEGVGICMTSIEHNIAEYMRAMFVCMYVVPLCICGFLHIRHSVEIKNREFAAAAVSSGKKKPSDSTTKDTTKTTKETYNTSEDCFDGAKEKQMQKYFVGMALIYNMLWAPLLILTLITPFVNETSDNAKYFENLFVPFSWLAYISTLTNSIMFFWWRLNNAKRDKIKGYLRLSHRRFSFPGRNNLAHKEKEEENKRNLHPHKKEIENTIKLSNQQGGDMDDLFGKIDTPNRSPTPGREKKQAAIDSRPSSHMQVEKVEEVPVLTTSKARFSNESSYLAEPQVNITENKHEVVEFLSASRPRTYTMDSCQSDDLKQKSRFESAEHMPDIVQTQVPLHIEAVRGRPNGRSSQGSRNRSEGSDDRMIGERLVEGYEDQNIPKQASNIMNERQQVPIGNYHTQRRGSRQLPDPVTIMFMGNHVKSSSGVNDYDISWEQQAPEPMDMDEREVRYYNQYASQAAQYPPTDRPQNVHQVHQNQYSSQEQRYPTTPRQVPTDTTDHYWNRNAYGYGTYQETQRPPERVHDNRISLERQNVPVSYQQHAHDMYQPYNQPSYGEEHPSYTRHSVSKRKEYDDGRMMNTYNNARYENPNVYSKKDGQMPYHKNVVPNRGESYSHDARHHTPDMHNGGRNFQGGHQNQQLSGTMIVAPHYNMNGYADELERIHRASRGYNNVSSPNDSTKPLPYQDPPAFPGVVKYESTYQMPGEHTGHQSRERSDSSSRQRRHHHDKIAHRQQHPQYHEHTRINHGRDERHNRHKHYTDDYYR